MDKEIEELLDDIINNNGDKSKLFNMLDNKYDKSFENEIEFSKIPLKDLKIVVKNIIIECDNPFTPVNEYDNEFITIINYCKEKSSEDLLMEIVKRVNNLKITDPNGYNAFVKYFARFPLWGSLNPDYGDFETLKLRANVLKFHIYDFLWLYRRLNDYLSKRTLTAILSNWAFLDMNYLVRIKSIFRDYWEPDIFLDNKDDILVDVGAYIGDSIAAYVQTYGQNYKKIYAYEITKSTCVELQNNIRSMKLKNVIVKQKGLGSKNDKLFILDNDDKSANSVKNKGNSEVDIVKLDDDITDIPTFIKMDIEGAETDALYGAENIITNHSPKLAICTYHGYDDIWRIPNIIDNMNNKYKFYMRHNGGNLIPTEFVLLCNVDK